jgi:type II secretion system protein C
LAVFRIDRFGPSLRSVAAARGRLAALLPAMRKAKWADARTIRAIELALAVGIGALWGWVFWLALAPIDSPPAAPPPPPATAVERPAGPVNPFRIAGAAPAPAEAPSDVDLAETTLNLALHGTWVDEKGGVAIIKTQDEKQSRFAPGDVITSGVTLERVFQDQVIINRNGVRESLRLINRQPLRSAPAGEAAAPSAAAAPSGGAGLASIGRFILATPKTDAVGGVSLELQPAGDPQRFAALGLRPGDRLVAVDNQPIGPDIATGLQTIAMLNGRDAVTISIERGGVVMPITIDLAASSEGADE